MADDELRVRASMENDLSRPLEDIREDVQDVRQEMERTSRTALTTTRSVGGLRTGVGKLAGVVRRGLVTALRSAAIGIAALGAAAVVGFGKMISLATDAGETLSKFNTVFGQNRKEMERWAQGLHRNFGIATKDLRDAASTFGVFGQAAGIARSDLPRFSQSLAEAGLDLASFYNVSPEEAFLALRSGLAGEAEPLRRFGIFLSDATMKAKAAQMGLRGELTESEKVMVRQQLILGGLGKAQGDLERTSGSLANKWRALKGRITELATVAGEVLLPISTRVVTVLGDKLTPIITDLQERAPAMGKALDANLSGLWDTLQRGQEILGAGGIVQGMNAFEEQFPALAPLIEKVREVAGDLWRIWDVGLAPAFRDAAAIIPDLLQPLTLLDNIIGFVADHAAILGPLITALVVGFTAYKAVMIATAAPTFIMTKAQGLLNAVLAMNPVGLVIAGIAALAAGLIYAYKHSEGFRKVVQGVWGWLKKLWDIVKNVATTVGGALVTAWDTAKTAIGNALDWIMDKIRPVVDAVGKVMGVVGAVGGGVKRVGSWLNPFGDTATSKASGGGIANTVGIHGRLEAMTPGSRTITSGVRSWGPSGDHQAGRALDLIGSNLQSYARNLRAAGGLAEFHGSGRARHLHAAYPAGDTATPKARALSLTAPDGGGSAVSFGALLQINGDVNGADVDELEEMVVRAYRRIRIDEEERV